MQSELLDVRGLTISIGGKPLVKDINFTVPRGKIIAIVGESGSGKSLTALSLLQLLPPAALVQGQAIFKSSESGTDIYSAGEEKIKSIRGREISMIFQEPMTSLNPLLTCGYQVREAILLHQKISDADAKKQVLELFGEVELPNPESMYHRFPHQISGGQKQRVMIAMAICNKPQLLIADEPTTALDAKVQDGIVQLIKKIQAVNNMSVIFISHDLELVAQIADEILVMRQGEIVEQGSANEVLHHPQHWYSKALLACRPAPGMKGKPLPTIRDFIKNIDENSPTEKKFPPFTGPGEALLRVEHLSVTYLQQPKKLFKKQEKMLAVDGISFTVNKNEIIGLVGESGCGKTTVGRAIMQLIKPYTGNIILNGHNLSMLRGKEMRHARKQFQIVFQDPFGSLNPRLTVGAAISEPLAIHHKAYSRHMIKDNVLELLQQVQLPVDSYHKYPHQFSGGQRQRICIARALAVNPEFIIFDESTSALDVSVQAEILNLLQQLKNDLQFSAIFISHDLQVVHYLCDRILVMQHGKIVEEGTADNILNDPQQSYTKSLMSHVTSTF